MALSKRDIQRLHKESLENKEQYWEKVAEELIWTKKWTSVYEKSDNPFGSWFSGAELNVCYNCVDRHVNEGHGDQEIYVFDSPVTKTRRVYTFSDVLDQVSRLAGVLLSTGVRQGDVVMVIMPTIPEGAFSMLACARIGAIHACITGGLSPPDIATRLEHCKPKVVLIASHGFHSDGWVNYKQDLDAACDLVKNKPSKIILLQREQQNTVSMTSGRDLDWNEEMSKAKPVGCSPVGVSDPGFLIYTSGSTGEPKAVVHSSGIFAVKWLNGIQLLFGECDEHSMLLATVNYGWIAGAMLIAYGNPLRRLPCVIFEGDNLLSEDLDLFYSTLEKNKVNMVYVRPGVWKVINGLDPEGRLAAKYDLHRLKRITIGGERTDIATMNWVSQTFHSSLWNCYGQTETGAVISGAMYDDIDESYPKLHDNGIITPGFHVKILDEEGNEVKPYEIGRIALRLGVAPTSFVTLWNDHQTYLKKYFTGYPGYFDTMDQGWVDDEGCLRVESRADDMMKVGLHYITSQAIEEVTMKHKSISECVVVSSTDLIWKEIPVTIFVKKPDSCQTAEEIEKEVHDDVHSVLGATLKLGRLVEVKELPITRTGKLHRPSCRALVRGRDIPGLGAVENQNVLPVLKAALVQAGYGKNVLLD